MVVRGFLEIKLVARTGPPSPPRPLAAGRALRQVQSHVRTPVLPAAGRPRGDLGTGRAHACRRAGGVRRWRMRSPALRLLPAVAVLVACDPEPPAAPTPPAPRGTDRAGAEIPAEDALDLPWAIPPDSRCSGRWTGAVEFAHGACDEAALQPLRALDLVVDPGLGRHEIAVVAPAGFAAEVVHDAWSIDPFSGSCGLDLVLRSPGGSLDVALRRSTAGASRASLRVHTVAPAPCWTHGEIALEHVLDDSPLPAPEVAGREIAGHYRLNVLWQRDELCPPPRLPPRFEVRTDPLHSNRLGVAEAGLVARAQGEPGAGALRLAIGDDVDLLDEPMWPYYGEHRGYERYDLPIAGERRGYERYDLTIAGERVTGTARRRVADPRAVGGGECSDRGAVVGRFAPSAWRY